MYQYTLKYPYDVFCSEFQSERMRTIMTLNQIFYFIKAAELENFRTASMQLHISQPSLSRSMAQLEEELNVTLFEKTGRGIRLTKGGKLFYEHAKKIIADYDQAIDKMSEVASGNGKIDIGYVFPLAGHYIPRKVRVFLDLWENKHVTFNFVQAHTQQIAKQVNEGVLDLGFGGKFEDPNIEFYPIIDQEMVVITPKNHPLRHFRDISLDELNKYPIIGYDPNSWMGSHLKSFYEVYDLHPKIVVECPDEYSIVALVKEKFGIAFLPVTDVLADTVDINIHHIKDLRLYHEIFMFWKRDQYQLPSVRRFIQYMIDQSDVEIDSKNESKLYLKDIIHFKKNAL